MGNIWNPIVKIANSQEYLRRNNSDWPRFTALISCHFFLRVIVTPSSPKKCTISLFLKEAQRCKQMSFLLLVVAFRSTSTTSNITSPCFDFFWCPFLPKKSTKTLRIWSGNDDFLLSDPHFGVFPDVSWTRGPGSMVLTLDLGCFRTEPKPSKCVTWGQALDALQVIHYQSSFAWKKLIFDMWRCQRNC